jgi:hypothetical protein
MTALERQMAADAIALSKDHADRADAADARWQALKDYLAGQIEQARAVIEDLDGSFPGTAARARVIAAENQSTLAKMRELEPGHD